MLKVDHGFCCRGIFWALGALSRLPSILLECARGRHALSWAMGRADQTELEKERALAVRRRGTREELGGAAAHHRSEHNDRRKNTNLHQHNRGGNHGNRSRTVHRNAKRALVRGAFVLMDVRHLDHRQQRQQHKAQNRHHGQSR